MPPLPKSQLYVELQLRSGRKHVFEITEEILADLRELQRLGMTPHQICATWLRVPPLDAPLSMRVVQREGDKVRALAELDCSDDERPDRSNEGVG